MSNLDLFIFDFDGTLVDSKAHIANSVNYALKKERLSIVNPEIIYPSIGKRSIQETFRYLYPRLTNIQVDNLTEQFRSYLLEHASEELTFYPYVHKTLLDLKLRNHKLAILTTKRADSINSILSSLKINHLFDIVYGSGMPGGNKPDSGCILYIAKKTKTPLTEIVMVGDTSVDALTAINAGVKSIGVTYGIDGENVRNAGFTHVITNFKTLLNFG